MVDRLITLFESTATDFSTNGIGPLPDAIMCRVTEEANGPYELEMDYPITGQFYDEILFRRILLVKPNPYANRQPFRIYAISKPISGRVTVNAQHISYDLSNYTVSPITATTVVEAFEHLFASMDNIDNCPFSYELPDGKATAADLNITKPMSAKAILGGVEGSILDTYRGEYEWDGYKVKLWNNRGEDRGVAIRYGKNLTDLRQEENISEVYTAVRPYWYRESTVTQSVIDEDTQTEETSEEKVREFVELTNTVSGNLIIDSVKNGDDDHLDIDSTGKIVTTSSEYKLMFAKIQNGVKYTIRCDSTDNVVAGFFASYPELGSVAETGQQSVSMAEFIAPIDGYIAFRVANDYTYSIVDRLPYNIVFVDAYSDYNRILPLDLTSEFNDKPTEEELSLVALLYINEHDLGSPKVSLEVSFVNLSDASEYADLKLLETVRLFDYVDVVFPKLGVNATAKVVKTIYDALAGRYESIELGNTKADLSTTISVANKEAKEKVTTTELSQAVSEATRLITGQTGGYVVLNPPEHPQEIFILDAASGGDIEQAVNVWRWNSKGLAHSSTGYRGEFDTAIMANGSIVANFITSGTMSASRIFGDTLILGKNPNLETPVRGSLIIYDERDRIIGELNSSGLFLFGTDGFYLLANPQTGFAGFQMTSTSGNNPDPSNDTKLFWVDKNEFHMKKAVVEEDINFYGKMKFIPIEMYESGVKVNDGIALVASS